MKIAVLSSGDIANRKGLFNNVYERIKHLKIVKNIEVDVFFIQHYDDWCFKLLRTKHINIESETLVDDIVYHNLWVRHDILDYIFTHKLRLKDMMAKRQLGKFVDKFECYDLLSVHTLDSMYLAHIVKEKYAIPYVMTWHGSDVNVVPFRSRKTFNTVKKLMVDAGFNFFVSKALMKTSEKILTTNNKDYLYTGPADIFMEKHDFSRIDLRVKYGIDTKYVIGFVGNLIKIKNVLSLPGIFDIVRNHLDDVSFLIAGDGNLGNELKKKFKEKGLTDVVMLGRVAPSKMVEIIHCLDVLVLPSLNEGMPRVILEAVCSGVNVVGSNVGGIPELIGNANSFVLDESFEKNIAERIVEILKSEEKPNELPEEFSWKVTLNKEMGIYQSLVCNN